MPDKTTFQFTFDDQPVVTEATLTRWIAVAALMFSIAALIVALAK
jgi:hypothetical protein